jgi:hypothetical protein
MNRLQKLSTDSLVNVATRFLQSCHAMMRRYAAGSADALKYGWDWSTFGVLYPRKRALWSKVCAEAKTRGLQRATDPLAYDPFRRDGFRIRRKRRTIR